jgi:hypothetical protein
MEQIESYISIFKKARFPMPEDYIRTEVCSIIYQRFSNDYLNSHYEPEKEKWREKAKEVFLEEVVPKINFDKIRDTATSQAIYIMNYLKNPDPSDPREYYEKVLKGTSAVEAFQDADYWVTHIESAKKYPQYAQKYLPMMREMKTIEDYYPFKEDGCSFGAFKKALKEKLIAENKITDEQMDKFPEQVLPAYIAHKEKPRSVCGDWLLRLALINAIEKDLKIYDETWGPRVKDYIEEQKRTIKEKLNAVGINAATLKLTLFAGR